MLNPNRFSTEYDELISFYPDYYQKIKEMQAILRAQGAALDEIVKSIDVIIDNNFIQTASLGMIERLESFLGILSQTNDIETRRQNILSYFLGFGHISATKLKSLIRTFTQEDTIISFDTKDENGSYILSITISKKQGVNPDWDVLYKLLDNRIPAHIETCRVIVYPSPILNYCLGVAILTEEEISFTVTDYDFSNKDFLTDHEGVLLMYNGSLLYQPKERTGD